MIFSLTGTIVDSQSKEPINGAKVSLSDIIVFSDSNGNFNINGDIEDNNLLSLIVSFSGYQFINVPIYKGDNTIKDDVGIIQLQPLIPSLEQDKLKSSQLDKDQVKNLTKSKKDISYYSQEILLNQVNSLKNTLIPSVITMVAAFGVTKINDISPNDFSKYIDQSSCPTQEELINLINRKNKLVKQLNNSLTLIDRTTKTLGIIEGIITLLIVPLLTAEATPPFSKPIPSGVEKRLDRTIFTLQATNKGILAILLILRQTLIQAIQLLNLLDQLIQKCYPDAEQEQIAFELNQLTQQQSNQLDPVVINVNGFEMGVETEITEKPLKRRRAIARNKQGVIMLKGEWSFSSIDQILIDELVFYIQQNNLKAD